MFDRIKDRLRTSTRRVQYAQSMPGPGREEQAELIALLRERPGGLSWTQLAGAVLERGSAASVRADLVPASLFHDEEHTIRLETARRDLSTWLASGLEFWTIVDDRYPSRVRDIQEAPPFLFARGRRVSADVAVSVVGSRQASERGIQMARSISEALVSMNVSVVAGLAAGIDTAAHESALRSGGRTVAVIGTGISNYYPTANRALQDRIARDGLLLSQFWPDAPPQQHNFPMRNAVMSGYGMATVVVEAGERSGARIQARMAVHHGRPVILTDLVVNSTAWGREILSRPDVYVAASVDDVMNVVGDLVSRPAHLGTVLSQIAI